MSRVYDEDGAGIVLGGPDNPISKRTLQRWRATGCGPAYFKPGRKVRYTEEALEAYKAAQRRTSTSEAA